MQTYTTLHFTRRFYNGQFVPNAKLGKKTDGFVPEDSVHKLVPAVANDPQARDQITPLAGRLFGTWTMVSCMVRLYAAYNLHLGPVYDMAICTYAIALVHFIGELLVFKGMRLGGPQTIPLVLAVTALIWMPTVRSHYVQIE